MGLMLLKGKGWLSKILAMYQTDGRRHVRLPAEFQATLSGPFGTVAVAGVDAHRDGAGVQAPHELPLGTLVFLRINNLGLMGFAHVRHCSLRGDGYLLGLQFREGLSRDRERDSAGDWNIQRLAQAGCCLWDEAEA